MDGGQIGRSARRVEDRRFLTGQGRYVEDIVLPASCISMWCARRMGMRPIDCIDTAAAETMPACAVLHRRRSRRRRHRPAALHCAGRAPVDPIVAPPRLRSARARVRHVGEPVAFVVARNRGAGTRRRRADRRRIPAAAGGRRGRRGAGPRRAAAMGGGAGQPVVSASSAATAPRSRPLSPVRRTSSRSSSSTIGSSSRRSNRARRSEAGTRHPELRPAADRAGGPQPPRAAGAIGLSSPPGRMPRARARMSAAGSGSRISSTPNMSWCCWRRAGSAARSHGSATAARISSARAGPRQSGLRPARGRCGGRFLALDVETEADLGAYLSANGPGCSTNSASSAIGGVYAIPAILLRCAAPSPTPCRSMPIAAPASRKPIT